MQSIFTSLVFLLFLSLEAEAGWRPLARYYKLVPEKDALISSGSARARELSPTSIKAIVWNIKKTQMASWQTEFEQFQNRDIFLIQEAYGNERMLQTIGKFHGVRWDFGISFLYRIYNDAPTGNMIGSSVEPSEVKVLHSPDYEPVVETPKSNTFAKYPLEGSDKELLVISVHGINLTTFGAFKRHMNQARKEIEAHSGPVIFAGDFNTRTGARTRYLMQMVDELKFTPVVFKNGERRMKFKFTPYYLDHSFVRDLKVKSAEVLADSQGSDHKPMDMELEAIP